MWVEFEFGLGRQRYRVWRQRSKKGRGQSDLHFYVWDAACDDWQLLDDGGLLERQAQIIRTLRLDYETFTNSAFLLQGRADSFTVKTASERKQILADILGLSRYDLYEERGQGGSPGAQGAGGADRGGDPGDRARAGAPRRLRGAAQRGPRGGRWPRSMPCGWRKPSRRAAGRRSKGCERRRTSSPICATAWAAPSSELSAGRQQLEAAKARLAQIEAVLAQRDEIEAGWAALPAARADDSAWNARLLRHTQLQEQVNGPSWRSVRRGWRWRPSRGAWPTVMPSSAARSPQGRSRRSTWPRRSTALAHLRRSRGAPRRAGRRAARGRRAVGGAARSKVSG